MAAKPRIVSLVPSLTHMVADLGLEARIVGCTTFCVEPPRLAKQCALVGGTKDPDMDAIRALKPTHILVNEEENKPEHIEACRQLADTFVTFPKGPGEVPGLLREAGEWLSVQNAAARFARETEELLASLDATVESRRRAGDWSLRRCLYYIWREPYMVVSQDTYISAMLERLGLVNVAPSAPRYPTLTVEEAQALKPDFLLLSSEPYPFRKRDAVRLAQEWPAVPQMYKIDGQLMSWYGTMLIPALQDMERWVRGESTTGLIKGF